MSFFAQQAKKQSNTDPSSREYGHIYAAIDCFRGTKNAAE